MEEEFQTGHDLLWISLHEWCHEIWPVGAGLQAAVDAVKSILLMTLLAFHNVTRQQLLEKGL